MDGVKYFLILWIITILLNNFGFTLDSIHYNNFTATFAHIVELFSFNYFGGYIGYLLLGYYISNKEFKLSKTNLVYIGFILLIVFLIVNFYITMVRSNCMAYLYFTVILESVGVYLILKNSSIINNIKFNSIIGKITVLISKNSYGMYFSHSIVIGVLFVIFSIAKTSKIYLPIMFILTVIISFIINYILSKIPILNKFSG